jgi:putative endonuclease
MAWWTRFWPGKGPLGPRAERVAAAHLRRNGYRLLARNLRSHFGEIDLLMEDRSNGQIVVVEVKAGSSDDPPPEVHLNHAKQRKLSTLAAALVQRYRLGERSIRFDLVAIVWPDGASKPTRLDHHVSAFESLR